MIIKHYQSLSENEIQKALRHIPHEQDWNDVRKQTVPFTYHHTAEGYRSLGRDLIKEAIAKYSRKKRLPSERERRPPSELLVHTLLQKVSTSTGELAGQQVRASRTSLSVQRRSSSHPLGSTRQEKLQPAKFLRQNSKK